MAPTATQITRTGRGGTLTSEEPGAPGERASARRHWAWLAGGAVLSFLVPFVLADRIGLQDDLYCGLWAIAVLGLFGAWARDTGQSVPGMLSRHWRWALGLGLLFAGVSVAIVLGTEDATARPEGAEFVGALIWRGLLYGSIDGLMLSAFPILVVFAALAASHLRRRRGGILAVGAIALAASLAITAIYHLGYSDFRSEKLRRPVAGDLIWSVPTLATLNPVGAPIAHAGLHVAAVAHSYETDVFLPPHDE